ncbi:MAG: hypothetical protein Q4F18_10540 [Clostridia bacterium]|nr:hypothetical protein [Clostridia bacterium]
MSETSKTKKGFGVYATVVAAVLSLAAGIYFQMIGGTFGATKRVCYDTSIVVLLIGAAVVAAVLIALKRYGLASAVVTAMPGAAILSFVHKCYWYVSDVFVAIDEKGFDQKFIAFVALAVAAFVIGEIAIYARKTRPVKA